LNDWIHTQSWILTNFFMLMQCLPKWFPFTFNKCFEITHFLLNGERTQRNKILRERNCERSNFRIWCDAGTVILKQKLLYFTKSKLTSKTSFPIGCFHIKPSKPWKMTGKQTIQHHGEINGIFKGKRILCSLCLGLGTSLLCVCATDLPIAKLQNNCSPANVSLTTAR